MKKSKYVILPMLVIFLAACGFDPDKAKEESSAALNETLSSYEHGEQLFSFDDENIQQEVFDFTNEEMEEHFTKNFIQEVGATAHEINDKVRPFEDNHLFFLSRHADDNGEYAHYRQYEIMDDREPEVNEETETVRFPTSTESLGGRLLVIEMAQEDDEWKINGVSND